MQADNVCKLIEQALREFVADLLGLAASCCGCTLRNGSAVLRVHPNFGVSAERQLGATEVRAARARKPRAGIAGGVAGAACPYPAAKMHPVLIELGTARKAGVPDWAYHTSG